MVTRGERWSAGEAIFEFELPHQWDWVLGSDPTPSHTHKACSQRPYTLMDRKEECSMDSIGRVSLTFHT